MKILNLTQHPASAEQVSEGVIDLPQEFKKELVQLLTFEELPSSELLLKRAKGICALAQKFADNKYFMIGGAPFFMATLERELSKIGTPMYAFSQRVSEEVVQEDGSTRKVAIFKHLGFIKGGVR